MREESGRVALFAFFALRLDAAECLYEVLEQLDEWKELHNSDRQGFPFKRWSIGGGGDGHGVQAVEWLEAQTVSTLS